MKDLPMINLADDPATHRYVIDADGRRAGFLSYRLDGEQMALVHTEIDPAVQRHGLGSQLVAYALEDARERGLAVLPHCPFVRHYMLEHPELRDLVPSASRPRFGL
jgi:predicted GNAT family acetyltransferase